MKLKTQPEIGQLRKPQHHTETSKETSKELCLKSKSEKHENSLKAVSFFFEPSRKETFQPLPPPPHPSTRYKQSAWETQTTLFFATRWAKGSRCEALIQKQKSTQTQTKTKHEISRNLFLTSGLECRASCTCCASFHK